MTSEPRAHAAPPPDDPYDQPLDVRPYLRAIWKNAWVIGLGSVLGAAIGLALNWYVPETYQATARINISHSGPTVPPEVQAKYRELLDDPVVAQHVVTALRLDQPPLALTPAQLRGRLSSRVGDAAGVILIDARLSDPVLVTRVVVEAAKHLAELARERDSNATASSLAALTVEQTEAQRLVDLALAALVRYRQQEGNVAIARRGTSDLRSERELVLKLEQELESDRAALRVSTALLASEPYTMPQQNTEAAGARVVNPAYVALAEQKVESRLRIAGLEARIQHLRRTLGKVPGVEELAAYEAGLVTLQAELRRAQAFQDQLGESSFQLRRDSVLPRFSLKYTEEPTEPATIVAPNRKTYMATGAAIFFLMLLVGVLLRSGVRGGRSLGHA